jgi:hypothetical protein
MNELALFAGAVEIDKDYYEAALGRIKRETRQLNFSYDAQ